MEGLKPGRIVYYVNNEGLESPAMVTRVHTEGGIINLSVIVDGQHQLHPYASVPFSADPAPQTWHWMFDGQQARYKPDRVETSQPAGS